MDFVALPRSIYQVGMRQIRGRPTSGKFSSRAGLSHGPAKQLDLPPRALRAVSGTTWMKAFALEATLKHLHQLETRRKWRLEKRTPDAKDPELGETSKDRTSSFSGLRFLLMFV